MDRRVAWTREVRLDRVSNWQFPGTAETAAAALAAGELVGLDIWGRWFRADALWERGGSRLILRRRKTAHESAGCEAKCGLW